MQVYAPQGSSSQNAPLVPADIEPRESMPYNQAQYNMPEPDTRASSRSAAAPEPRRLNSWKEVAAYLGTTVRTAHRWERSEALPIRRHGHTSNATAYAYTDELESWLQRRTVRNGGEAASEVDSPTPLREGAPASRRFQKWLWVSGAILVAGCAVLVAAFVSAPGQGVAFRTRNFSSFLPAQMYPAWSPDGKSIAYIGTLDGRLHLMVQPLNAPKGTSLTGTESELAARQFPFWSPDSKMIYFFERNPAGGLMSLGMGQSIQ